MGKTGRIDHRRRAEEEAVAALKRMSRRQRLIPGVSVAVVFVAVIITLVLVMQSSTPGIVGLMTFSETNHRHVTTIVKYDHNPPVGGPHDQVWLNCGIYDVAVRNENAVHSLEHGSVWITYRPNLPLSQVGQLRNFVQTHYNLPQRYLVLSPYPGLPAPVVASAWGAQLYLHGASDPRLLQFVKKYIGGNQGTEQGASCTGGVGTPIG